MCNPGRECLVCKHKDCILKCAHKVFPEETEMMKCAELPSSARGKKKSRQSSSDGSSKEFKKTEN